MKEVFADSSYFIALLNPRDKHHDKAREASRAAGSFRLVTSDLVLAEVLNGLAADGAAVRRSAVEMIRRLKSSAQSVVEPATSEGFSKAMKLYEDRSDKQWGLVDCSSIAIMQERGLREVLSSDHHFVQAGFSILMHP